MQYHCYRNNTQMYMTVESDECIIAALTKDVACVAEVADWMEINQQKLTVKKSKAIIFLTAKQRVDLPSEISLTIAVLVNQYLFIYTL